MSSSSSAREFSNAVSCSRSSRVRWHRLNGARFLGLAALLVVGGCEISGQRGPRAKQEELNRDLLEKLMTGDSVTPVQDFDEDAYFEELERLYGDLDDEPVQGAESPAPRPPVEGAPMNPYSEFGQRIWVDEDSGFITKPFPFPPGMADGVLNLLLVYGDFEIDGTARDGVGLPSIADQRPEAAVFDLRVGVDAEAFTGPRNPALTNASSVTLSDWLLVRAQPMVLMEVERFINLFGEKTRQIEIEAKIVEVTTSDTLDYGIRPVDESTPIFGLPNSDSLINSIDYSFGNTVDSSEAIFGVASVFDGVEFNALLEIVSNAENVSIVSRPKVAVREGAQADIVDTRGIPFFNIQAINANGTFKTQIQEIPVGVQMFIVPRVVGDSTIVLNIDIEVSQETGTAIVLPISTGDDSTSVLTVPEISRRATRTVVRLEPGQAVILGGLISNREAERVRKIPILGDIPFLGYLFKNEFLENEQTNVLFFIRPRILEGGEFAGDDF